MQRWKKWLVAIMGLVALAAVWHLWLAKSLGFTERDFAQVEIGMTKEQVLKILGEPGHGLGGDRPTHDGRFVRGALGAKLGSKIGPTSNYCKSLGISQAELEEIRAEAAEVWRWGRFIQTIGVVFDDNGRVMFKWVDY